MLLIVASLGCLDAPPGAGAVLTVEVAGPIVSVIGEVGIEWQNVGADDSYQLEVADRAGE